MFEYTDYHIAPWGWEIPLYFFLIGTAGMVYVLACAPTVFGGVARVLAPFQRTGALLALILLLVCAPLLALDLGQPGRFLYPIIHFHWTSPLSWGALFLPLFGLSIVGFVYALMKGNEKQQRLFGIVGSLLALAMPLYTGLDLMVNQARELWANPAIPVLFVILSITSGTTLGALVMMAAGTLDEDRTRLLRNILYASVGVTLALFLAMWLVLTYGTEEEQQAYAVINELYGMKFWLLTLVVGILAPLAVLVVPNLATNALAVTGAGVLASIGAYTFREVLIYAGQLPMMTY